MSSPPDFSEKIMPDTPEANRDARQHGKVVGWLEDRTGLVSRLNQAAGHRVPRRSGWAFVFGSATLFAFILQVVSGITLAMFFEPATATAYQSLQQISTPGSFEALVRGLHYFGASLMVVMAGIHMARVYLMAAYKYPREVQWLSGVLLLFLVLAMAFTGQTLRWDQNALWSVVVGAEQAARAPFVGPILARFLLAGDTLNAATLSRLFSLHVFWFPAIMFGLIGLHVFLVLRNGISETPVPGRKVDPRTYKQDYQARVKRDGVPFWPDAAWRDTVFGSALILLMVFLAWKIGAPELGKPPDPSIVQADPKPDWYLIWYFSVLALWPYAVTNIMIIAAPLLALVALLALPFVSNKGERSPSRRPWAIAAVVVMVGLIFSLTVVGYREPWLPHFKALPLSAQTVGSTDPAVIRGAALFHSQSCILCHQIDGQGGIRGPDLSQVGARLSRDQLIWRIQNGAASMPPYAGVLTDQQLRDVVGFLETRK
ncbi:cytochrome b N-terminal domain-containing protein [Deinococcus rubellus]|uniref:Cytochrome b N-terminal domain-containing protein n=1 Tax=Deinococcus rubellus TaxID=1889240 RepID=A0ABY5YJ09_9DEIO|nr:cytochrome b N-terminal domain-containing protein [Deinococcus rubellus]UWX63773.1 cytochrome b N-terminal domain-containing protein [Deinococcus rubellus]